MTLPSPTNALMPRSAFERSLDAEIRSLVWRHGADEVRAATKRQTAKKRGRKRENDWQLLGPYVEQDARDWLDGRDPCQLRSNYSIAKTVSEKAPGHSVLSTHRRLMGKLAGWRKRMMLYAAIEHAEKERPFLEVFEILVALGECGDDAMRMAIHSFDYRKGQLQRYRETIGEPIPELTFAEIEQALNQPLALPNALRGLNTLFGIQA